MYICNTAEVADCLAYLSILHNPCDDEALSRCILLQNKLGKHTLEKLHAVSEQTQSTLLECVLATLDTAGLQQVEKVVKASCTSDNNHWSEISITNIYAAKDRLSILALKQLLVQRFAEQLLHWRLQADILTLSELLQTIAAHMDMYHILRQQAAAKPVTSLSTDDFGSGTDDTLVSRWDNVVQLIEIAKRHSIATAAAGGILSLFDEVAVFTRTESDTDAVQLMTMHKSKGLEFDTVFLISVNERLYTDPASFCNNDEERRLMYVAISRAQTHLYISSTKGLGGFAAESIEMSTEPMPEVYTASQDTSSSTTVHAEKQWHRNQRTYRLGRRVPIGQTVSQFSNRWDARLA
jgi:superfamily I DNA/RNA helicase